MCFFLLTHYQVVLGGVMKAWGVEPDHVSYNTIMDAFARNGNVNSVMKVFKYMQVCMLVC